MQRRKGKAQRGDKISCSKECHSELLSCDKPSKKELQTMYVEKEFTQKRISQEFQVSRSTVIKWMNSYNISSRARGPTKGKYDSKSTLNCDECGEEIKRWDCDQSKHNFCSRECYDSWQKYRTKEGRSEHYYGDNWKKQRKNTLERDSYACQVCDSKNDLVVHHKKPVRTFDKAKKKWYKQANDLDNLITMCRSCHSKIHGKNAEKESDLVKLDLVSESDHRGV